MQGGESSQGLLAASCLTPVLSPALVSQVEALKEENDSLRWQLDAYRNEVELLKQEQGKATRDEDTTKEQQMKLLQQALQGMQKVGLELSIVGAVLQGKGLGWAAETRGKALWILAGSKLARGSNSVVSSAAKKTPKQILKPGIVCELISPMEAIHS